MTSSLPENLRLLCQYVPSVSRVVSDLKMNRQQFYRYMNGQCDPPLRKLRLISDYFGLEESEMLLPHPQFREIVAIKGVHSPVSGPFAAQVSSQFNVSPESTARLRPLAGYYYAHVRAAEVGARVTRTLTCLYESDGYMKTKSIESYANVDYRKRRTLKYNGFAYSLGQELYLHEREVFTGRMIWTSIFRMSDSDQFSMFNGISVGVTSASQRSITAYRITLQRIDDSLPRKEMLRGCGVYDPDSPQIAKSVRDSIQNDIRPHEIGFTARYWEVPTVN